jgi:hypothetical protein
MATPPPDWGCHVIMPYLLGLPHWSALQPFDGLSSQTLADGVIGQPLPEPVSVGLRHLTLA